MNQTENKLNKTSVIGFIMVAICLVFLCFLKLHQIYFREYFIEIKSSSEFESIKNGIVYFGRPSCPECKTVEPIIQDVSNERHVRIYYFNTDLIRVNENIDRRILQEYLLDYKVETVPTIIIIRNGVVVERISDMLQADSNIKDGLIDAVLPYKAMANQRTPFHMITTIMMAVSIVMLLLSYFLDEHLQSRKWLSWVILCDICMMLTMISGWALGIMYIEKNGGSGNPEETINGLIANGIMVITTVYSIIRYRLLSAKVKIADK